MLVDRDKAIEACAKVCDREAEHFGTVASDPALPSHLSCHYVAMDEGARRCAAAIRQLTLEDCRAESSTDVDALLHKLRKHPFFWLNGSRWVMGTEPEQICVDAADLIESLSAQVEEAKDYVSAVDEENHHMKRQVAELTEKLKTLDPMCKSYGCGALKLIEKCVAADAKVAELRKDAEKWRTLQAAVNANPLPDSPEDIEAWAKTLARDTCGTSDAAKESGNE